jgi:hypothetical protein
MKSAKDITQLQKLKNRSHSTTMVSKFLLEKWKNEDISS